MPLEYSYYSNNNGHVSRSSGVILDDCYYCNRERRTCGACLEAQRGLESMESKFQSDALDAAFGPSKRERRVLNGYNYVHPTSSRSSKPASSYHPPTAYSVDTSGHHYRDCDCYDCQIADWKFDEGMRRAAEEAERDRSPRSQKPQKSHRSSTRSSKPSGPQSTGKTCSSCRTGTELWDPDTGEWGCADPSCPSYETTDYEEPPKTLRLGWR